MNLSWSYYLVLLIALLVRAELPAAERLNVLLICVDDLKPALGCYGDAVAKSPNIDALAARGVTFQKAYCNQAVCSPSRNALLTSLRSQTLGIYDLSTNFRIARPDAITLPQLFKQNGYHTQAMGKIFHVGHGNHEDAASWSVPHWRPSAVTYALDQNKASAASDEGTAKTNTKAGAKANTDPRGKPTESADVPDNTYADGAVADEAIQRLRTAASNADQPFFIAVGFVKPHLPFVAPKNYWDLYDANRLPLAEVRAVPQDAPSYAPQFGGELRQYRDVPAQGALDDSLQRQLVHGYYAAMSYTDAQIGRLTSELKRLHLDEKTIVVLWGDHGWHLGDHGMWCKHTNYEQAAHIPLVISAPGMEQGKQSRSLVESVDVYPTLCELAGLKAPAGLEGRSFAATLKDVHAPTKDYIVHVYPRSSPERGSMIGRAIRTDRYRLVQWKVPDAGVDTAEWELYDYVSDPLETKNIASSQPDVVARLQGILQKLPEPKPQIRTTAEGTGNATGNKNGAGNARPKQDRNAMFTRRDKDGDGKLTREEFLTGQPDPADAPARFVRFDKNQDGTLSRDEFVNSGK